MDALDLIFRIEKRFGITISQAEGTAVLFGTAGDIHRYLVAKLKGEYQKVPCLEPLFIEVAEAVNHVSRWWRRSADLSKRFAPATRIESWHALQERLGVSLPPLEHQPGEEFPRIPRECGSIVSLAYWIAEHHPARVEWSPVGCERTGSRASHQWDEEEIWTTLRECICNALGVSPDDVTYDVRMVEDLGME